MAVAVSRHVIYLDDSVVPYNLVHTYLVCLSELQKQTLRGP
jgi:hypothetical protein